MAVHVKKTILDGLSIEVKQDKKNIYVRPIVTNIHDLIETLLIEEGYQLTMNSITTTNTIKKLKNGVIKEKEGYKKLTETTITLSDAIKKRKKIKETIKFLIHQDKTLLSTIEKTLKKRKE